MNFARNFYLNELIKRKNNGQVKIITGIRRCGKSYLLFKIFDEFLKKNGVSEHYIIKLALDNVSNAVYRDPLKLMDFIKSKIIDDKQYYIFLDEIQFVGKKKIQENPDVFIGFYDVLNELMKNEKLDIYVTGSNSKMLSSDISTEFRGRGDIIRVYPLSFKELYENNPMDKNELFLNYSVYGGLPFVQMKQTDSEKKSYLTELVKETYLKDILERYSVEMPQVLDLIMNVLCSSVGSLTNASKIANSLRSIYKNNISNETISKYIQYIQESYLFQESKRFDVKGRKYFLYPSKYYCVDVGLRNAKLNFRQIEETHLMENIIYNDLVARGNSVDVGVVETREKDEQNQSKKIIREIDFVVNANQNGKKCYIQSALSMDNPEKEKQEMIPFEKLKGDFNQRIVITKTFEKPWTDEIGVNHIGLYDFLLR